MDQAGQSSEPPMKGFPPGRGDRPVARSARRMLRKPIEASRKRASPADAFCPEAPCPPWSGLIDRATTESSRNCQTLTVTPAEPGGYPRAWPLSKKAPSTLALPPRGVGGGGDSFWLCVRCAVLFSGSIPRIVGVPDELVPRGNKIDHQETDQWEARVMTLKSAGRILDVDLSRVDR
jgi:hypothetical protein